jgi:hypothetical protein
VEAGAQLDVRDNLLKSTPLGWACRWGCVELVKLLLELDNSKRWPLPSRACQACSPRVSASSMHSKVMDG